MVWSQRGFHGSNKPPWPAPILRPASSACGSDERIGCPPRSARSAIGAECSAPFMRCHDPRTHHIGGRQPVARDLARAVQKPLHFLLTRKAVLWRDTGTFTGCNQMAKALFRDGNSARSGQPSKYDAHHTVLSKTYGALA